MKVTLWIFLTASLVMGSAQAGLSGLGLETAAEASRVTAGSNSGHQGNIGVCLNTDGRLHSLVRGLLRSAGLEPAFVMNSNSGYPGATANFVATLAAASSETAAIGSVLSWDCQSARIVHVVIPQGVEPAPEPATLLMLGSGLVGAGFFGRRLRRKPE